MFKLSKFITSSNNSYLPVTNVIINQQIRNIVRPRKGPDQPRAKSKRFFVRQPSNHDPEEIKTFKTDMMHYKTSIKSLHQLFETEAKFLGKFSQKARSDKDAELHKENQLSQMNEYAMLF
jgi:hypothetical protein